MSNLDPDAPFLWANPLRSAVKQLLSDQKLTIPADIIGAVGWGKVLEGSIRVVADLDEPHHLVLSLLDQVGPLIAMHAKQFEQEMETQEATDILQSLADRYHPLSLEAKGHRVRLTERVLLHLGAEPGSTPWFVISARHERVEVMTLEYRDRRNAKWRDRTTVY